MSNKFLAIVIALIVLVGGIVWFNANHKSNNSKTSSSSAQPSNHVTGNGKTGVTLVEYGDYQCPVCEGYFSTVKQVTTQYADDIYFQFRNLPLSSIHQNAFAAARAAEAAAKQNKFWEMHDLLYQSNNWQVWTTSSNPKTYFDSYAQQLGLNVSQFDTDYASGEVNDLINADTAAFQKTGQQQATPTFFIDGQYVDNQKLVDSNGPSATKFADVINAAIAAKSKQ